MVEEFEREFLGLVASTGFSVHPRFEVQCEDDFTEDYAVVRVFPGGFDPVDTWVISANKYLVGGGWYYLVDPHLGRGSVRRFETIEEVTNFCRDTMPNFLDPFYPGTECAVFCDGIEVARVDRVDDRVLLSVESAEEAWIKLELPSHKAEELGNLLLHYAKLARERE